jgi:hypothetical protein
MKIIKVDLDRLKSMVKSIEMNEHLPIEMRTYKINQTQDIYLQVYVKKKICQFCGHLSGIECQCEEYNHE